ncbi:MAG: ABC transporter substrate-binding protein [Chloroflexi bacterium]|nr:ABC transporter substrate-binding protein [Chloroflexota bacterium]
MRWIVLLGIVVFVMALVVVPVGVTAQNSAQTGIQVGVVVQGADGQPQTFCISLEGESPNGIDALVATGLDVVLETGSLGSAVCNIAGDGCTPPGESCFCQCEGGEECAYWAYFRLGESGNWQYSPVGASSYPLADGAVDGWWWRDGSDPDTQSLPVVPFDEICGAQSGFPRTVTDGLEREVTIEAPPQRIASVTLGSDEILLELVGPGRLLGVTHFAGDSDISNIAEQLDDVLRTDLYGDPELLITLDADLVILSSYNNPAALDQMLDADVPVFALAEFNTLDDIRNNIRLLGLATGEEARAEEIVAEMDARLDDIQARVADQNPVRVLYYEPGGISYGAGSTIDEMITLAGGINVVAEADLGAYPMLDAEFILFADPDVVLLGGWFSGDDDPLASFTGDPVLGLLRAVENDRIYVVNDAHMSTVSQYIVLGVEDIARALYPNAFAG